MDVSSMVKQIRQKYHSPLSPPLLPGAAQGKPV
jgi:hypothetical protein